MKLTILLNELILPVICWWPDDICAINYYLNFVFVRDREGLCAMGFCLLSVLEESPGSGERGGGNL